MDLNKKNEQQERPLQPNDAEPVKETAGNQVVNLMKNNKLSLFLVVCLAVVFIGLTLQNSSERKQFEQEKSALVTAYARQIDSLRIEQITFATEVFSWSVRSELLRNNTENLNQLLTVFVQQSGANLVQVITTADKVILLSSDKKFEGTSVEDTTLLGLSKTTVQREANTVTIMSPIMGFNDKLGVLLVTLETNQATAKANKNT
jgi:cell division protein FtsL